jgi:hypothetical protein
MKFITNLRARLPSEERRKRLGSNKKTTLGCDRMIIFQSKISIPKKI